MHTSEFHPQPGTIGYSYIRFSTTEQRKGDGERRQLLATSELAKKLGVIIDEKLSQKDLGKSGYHGEHLDNGFGRFLAMVETGKIANGSILFVESLDRISRQKPMVALGLFSRIIQNGITIITTGDGQVFTPESIDNNGYQLFGIIAVMMRANDESEIKSQRSSGRFAGAWNAYKKTGKVDYKLLSQWPAWVSRNGDGFALNEHAALVRKVVALSLVRGSIFLCVLGE